MAQYKDGDSRTINGVTYTRQGGVWMPQGGNMFAPKLPGELQGQTLQNQRAAQEIQQAAATAAANTRKANAEATSAEIAAKTAQEQYRSQHPSVDTTGLYGGDYLKTLSPSDQNMVKALAEGRLAFPSGAALRAPFWQEKLSQVSQYDPTFDATNYNARAKGREAAITGKLAQSNNALNTAMGHLGTLYSQIDGTASHSGMFGLATTVNSLENAFLKGSGDPGVTNFQDTAQKLADELETAYRGSGGAEAGVVRQLQSLSPNASREQKIGVIRNAMDLLASKMAANLSQYDFGTGGKPTWNMLDQHTLDVLNMPQFQDIRDKYFAAPNASGSGMPPPPPTGPTGGNVGPSSNGYNESPDPQSEQFWNNAIRQGVPYGVALQQWQASVKRRGLVGQTPPDPSLYQKAQDYVSKNPNVPYKPVESIIRTPVSPLTQGMTDAAFSVPGVFVGHAANATVGSLPTALAGDQGARYNAVSGASHPTAAFMGDLAGTVGGAIGAGKAVAGIAPTLGAYGDVIGGTAGRAAMTGDTSFFGLSGAAQNPDHPVLGGVGGMAAGSLGNVAGRYVLGPAIRGAASGFNRAAGMFGAAPLDLPAPLSNGQSMIFRRANPTLDAIRSNLSDAANLNLPYSLADADPRLRILAGSAARKSPDVRAMAEDVFGARQQGQGERAIAQINQNLAPVGDVPTMMADAKTRAQAAASPLYRAAEAHPAPNDPQLMEMLDTPAGQQAIRRGYEIALNRGEKPGDLTFGTDADGNPIIKGLPNWKTLQYAKMGLDQVITDNTDALGKLDLSTPANRALNDLRSRFVARMGELNPDYAKANAAYESLISQGTAAQRGAAANAIRVTPEQTQAAVANAGPNLPLFQRGYASNMADQVERARMSGNPYTAIYGSMWQRAKVASVFPQGAGAFDRANALEGDMAKTGTELFGGSPTQPRAEADRMFDSPLANAAGDIAFSAAMGVPTPGLIRRGLTALADTRQLGIRGAKAKADQVAPILLNTDPLSGLQALDEIQRLSLARRGYVNRTGTYGGMFGAPLVAAPLIYGGNP